AIFWLGDMNFRVEKDPDEVADMIKAKKEDSHEQLKRAMRDKEAFDGFTEQPITFLPTYRYYFAGNYTFDRIAKCSPVSQLLIQNHTSLVFVDSHFIHDVISYDKRIAQFHSNRICCFPEDEEVKAIFWLGDMNFRVEKDPDEGIHGTTMKWTT
ncbi:hypothetical protein ANCDUO_18531, partial [Ancylostoma duodenale]